MSTSKPTKAEAARIERLIETGCIVCRLTLNEHAHPEIHHILRGNKRLGHWWTIPLCTPHHRGTASLIPSIAHGRKLFAEAYGSEWDLWIKTQHLLGLDDTLPPSKLRQRLLG